MDLYTAAQMREIDRIAIEERGIPSLGLMENAARAVVREVRSLPIPGPRHANRTIDIPDRDGRTPTPEEIAEFWAIRQRSAVVLCGTGNNGGDGMAAARMLLELGWRVKCLLVGDRSKMTSDCREMERRFIAAGGEVQDNPKHPERCGGADVAIDALYGVGLNRELSGEAEAALNGISRAGWVVAVDIPSGVRADTGEMMGLPARADVTVTFSRGKPGLFVDRGAVASGRVVVADIGIPDDLYRSVSSETFLVERDTPGLLSLPCRQEHGHKGDFGKLFILAGSRGYTGAAALCAKAAVRSGVGLVTLAVPEDVYPILAVKCDEAMVRPWPEDDDELVEMAEKCTVAVIGPGLGQGERAERLVLRLMRELTCPVILDADGLNIISRHIHILDEREGPTILTPHDGEFARLCGREPGSGSDWAIQDRLGAAREFAKIHHCALVLKGHRTITAKSDGTCFINSTGNSGMAKGGSGDVLAGMMGALAAQNGPGAPDRWGPVFNRAVLAVWLHGRAGDLAAADKGKHGMTPSDLIEQIPYAMKELL